VPELIAVDEIGGIAEDEGPREREDHVHDEVVCCLRKLGVLREIARPSPISS
jgi:hypothetical protein